MKKLLCYISVGIILGLFICCAGNEAVRVTYDGKIAIAKIQPNLLYLSNRDYVFQIVPQELKSLEITILPGGVHKPIEAMIPANTLVYICIDSGKNAERDDGLNEFAGRLRADGWTFAGRISTSDKRMQYLRVYKKQFLVETTMEFAGVGFPGTMIASQELEIDGPRHAEHGAPAKR